MKILLAVLLTLSAVSAGAGMTASSDEVFLFLQPEKSFFWNTATNSTVSLPVDYPCGATSARLNVKGDRYEKDYGAVPEGFFELELPKAEDPGTENVFELTLTFDDGTVRTASLTVIEGMRSDGGRSARCRLYASGYRWSRVLDRAVLPVAYDPSGLSLLTVDGQTVDTGLGGAAGWYLFNGIEPGASYKLGLGTESSAQTAELRGGTVGVTVLAR